MILIQAMSLAICQFDVDHAFPYSRGGQTNERNLYGMATCRKSARETTGDLPALDRSRRDDMWHLGKKTKL